MKVFSPTLICIITLRSWVLELNLLTLLGLHLREAECWSPTWPKTSCPMSTSEEATNYTTWRRSPLLSWSVKTQKAIGMLLLPVHIIQDLELLLESRGTITLYTSTKFQRNSNQPIPANSLLRLPVVYKLSMSMPSEMTLSLLSMLGGTMSITGD